jgi:hypothetical protein
VAPRVTDEDSAEGARTPSRAVAAGLTLLFGSGVGHEYLGRTRRATLWACVPILVGLCGCLVIARLGVGYRLFVPGVILALITRGFRWPTRLVSNELTARRAALAIDFVCTGAGAAGLLERAPRTNRAACAE